MTVDLKLIAHYFPQLHPIPENDEWWGKGFTDWVNVRKAMPLFSGHRQPRVPAGRSYYDQSQAEVIRRQVALAKTSGISGFCHYHYWFDGKQLLETPTNLFLEMKDLDFEFCLCWANETWSRRWDGLNHLVLQKQVYPDSVEAWERHFQYLYRAWCDRRAIRIANRPLFIIYRPEQIPTLGAMLDYWRTRIRSYGIADLHFMGVAHSWMAPWTTLRHLDSVLLFQPSMAKAFEEQEEWERRRHSLTQRAWGFVQGILPYRVRAAMSRPQGPMLIDYDRAWRTIISHRSLRAIPTYEGAFVDWDNTARYGSRARVYVGATPEKFEHWMRQLIHKVSVRPAHEQLIFINAWNEWAEGAYLEPDEEFGMKYLDATRRLTEELRQGHSCPGRETAR